LQSLIDLRQAHNQVAALADVGHEALRQLAAGAPTRTFAPGETIIRQGELGESIFFVLEGGVEVFVRRGDGRRRSSTATGRGVTSASWRCWATGGGRRR
jgi:CRP-like cAMP-binding protein